MFFGMLKNYSVTLMPSSVYTLFLRNESSYVKGVCIMGLLMSVFQKMRS